MDSLKRVYSRFDKLFCDGFAIETIFIVSTGRTGTKFFEMFFNSCFQDLFSIHEPYPDLFAIGMQKIRGHVTKKEVCSYIIQQRKELIERARRRNKRIYVESNPQSIYVIPELKRTFKNIKFLYVVRNPKEVIQSLYNLSPVNDYSKMLFYHDSDHRKRICPQDFSDNTLNQDDWNELNRLGKISWYWNKANSIIYDALKNDKNTLIVKFEDLFSDKDDVRVNKMREILDFFKLSEFVSMAPEKMDIIFKQKQNSTERKLISTFDDWSEKDKEMMLKITQEMRKVFNYS